MTARSGAPSRTVYRRSFELQGGRVVPASEDSNPVVLSQTFGLPLGR